MAKLIPGQLSMFSQMTYGTSHNATSSQELQDGHTPSDLQDGQMIEKSGRVAARASRLALQEKVKELTMSGTYGRTSFDSLEAVAHPSSWVSKLQARLGMVGSTESDLIWRAKTTPSTASIFRLAPSTRRTSGKDCIGAPWSTPTVNDAKNTAGPSQFKRNSQALNVQAAGGREAGRAWDQAQATWPTAQARDWKGPQGRAYKGISMDLPATVQHTAATTWPTPQHSDDNASRAKDPQAYSKWWLGREKSGSNLAHYTQGYYGTTGTTPSGSTEQTEKRGALNPEFVCWLMGFPPEWESCAPTAMPSSRRSRQK